MVNGSLEAPMRPAGLQVPPRTRAVQGLALLALAAAAWAVTAVRMDGMDAGPGTDLGGLGWFMGVWIAMTLAMMLPAAAPAAASLPRGSVGPFLAAYVGAWAAAGLVAYLLVEGVRSLELGFLAWDEAGRYVAGGAIVAAALYQLTPAKDACLRRCRAPAEVEYGVWCVGCTWALMGALFALGVMSVGWMVVLAVLIGAERLLPWRTAAVRGVALVLVTLGIAVALVPEDVPGLTIPGEDHDMQQMEMHR
jgi:predicted metal-binding membrane protein